MLTAAAPEAVSVATSTPSSWQSHVVETTAPQFLTLPVGNEVLPSAVLTPAPFLQGTSLNSLTQGFWQDLSVSLLALFGLVNAGLLIISMVRRRSAAKVARAANRQRIALKEEGPAQICRNPVSRLDSVITRDDWPTMISVGAHHSSDAARRARLADDAAELAALVMPSYRFYVLNPWGVVDSGTGARFENDAAAFAHARRNAGDGRIEVWRDGSKLMTVKADRLDEGFAGNGQSIFA